MTDPVGAAAPVLENVAVSPAVVLTPAVAVVGFACVVRVGDAMPTSICSLASVHPVVMAL